MKGVFISVLGWFLQNFEKRCIRTNMNTTVVLEMSTEGRFFPVEQ